MITAVDPGSTCFARPPPLSRLAPGGADGVTVTPFDRMIGQPGDLGRRIARNTQIILQDESRSAGLPIRWPAPGMARNSRMRSRRRVGNASARSSGKAGARRARSGLIATTLAGLADEREDDLNHRRRVMTGNQRVPVAG